MTVDDAERIHFTRTGEGHEWQMSTKRKGLDGWHCVFGTSIEDCLAQEFDAESKQPTGGDDLC